jgi:type II secretory pathway predicted ATPase ExeA
LYERHFGLSARPFREDTAAATYVALSSREAVLRRLRYGLAHAEGPVLLTGGTGVGKTLLGNVLARDLGWRTVAVTMPTLSAGELVSFLAGELGPRGGLGVPEALRQLRGMLAAESAAGRRVLLVCDEAHLIESAETFEALRLLLNFASQGPPDLGLLLLGAEDVEFRLPPALHDRLAARCVLEPLNLEEATAYLDGRIAAAGGRPGLLGPEVLGILHEAAEGWPRRLNRLADLSLLVAFAREQARPDLDAARLAVEEAGLSPLSLV